MLKMDTMFSMCTDNDEIVYWLTVRSTVKQAAPSTTLPSDFIAMKACLGCVSKESLNYYISLSFVL